MMRIEPAVYAVFISGWIFFQHHPMTHPTRHLHSELTGLHPCWFRYSTAQKYIDDGSEPLPIMTAVRHERPWKDWKDEEQPFADPDHGRGDHVSAENAWFQCKLNITSFFLLIHKKLTGRISISGYEMVRHDKAMEKVV